MEYLYHKGKFYPSPSNWNQLTGKQLVKIMAVLHSDIEEQPGRIKLMRILLGWTWWKLVTICGLHRMANIDKVLRHTYIPPTFGRYFDNTERLATAAEDLTQFLFEGNNLVVNLLPKYRGFYGPASSMANMRMGEFCFAEHYFLQWKETSEVTHLNNLVSVLYRPARRKQNSTDQRLPFEPNDTPIFYKKISRWPLPVRLAIAAWYEGCREEKIANNKPVFEFDGGDGSASLHGLWSVMRSVAKSGHFGDFDKVTFEFVDTIMMELHESIVEYQKMEAQVEANKLQNQHT